MIIGGTCVIGKGAETALGRIVVVFGLGDHKSGKKDVVSTVPPFPIIDTGSPV